MRARTLALVISLAATAHADDAPFTLEGEELKSKDGASVALGCAGRDLVVFKDSVYVACGAAGVVVVDVSDPKKPVVDRRFATEGDAIGFAVVGDEVRVRTESAKPIEKPKPKPRPRVEFVPLPDDNPNELPPPPPPPKPRRGPVWLAPERRENLLSLSAEAKAWLPISAGGFGTLLFADVTYRSPWPISAHASLHPLGLGFSNQGNILATSSSLVLTFDTRFAELGFGGGGMSTNTIDGPAPAAFVAQYFRFGAADGLNVRAETEVFSNPKRSNWDFATFRGAVEVPVGDRWMLVFRGGMSAAGWAFGDAGIRHLVRGDGGHGSLYVLFDGGGSGLFFNASGIGYGGPSVGLGLEVRP